MKTSLLGSSRTFKIKNMPNNDLLALLSKYNVFIFLLCVFTFPNGTIILKIIKLIFSIFSCIIVISNRKIAWNFYLNWLLMMFILSVASYFWATSKSYALDGIQTIFINTVCILFVFQLLQICSNWVNVIFKVITIAPIFRLVYLFFLYGTSIFSGLRNIGIETGYNAVGFIAAMGAAFAILAYIFYHERGKKDKKWLLLFVVDSVIVILSMSRKAIMYYFVPIIVYYVFSCKDFLKTIGRITIVILIVLFGYIIVINIPILYHYVGSGMESLFEYLLGVGGDLSASGRTTRILYGLEWFANNPIFGHGVLNYNYLFSQVEPNVDMVIADNNFIDIMVNYGIVGLIAYYSIFIFVFINIAKNSKTFSKTQLFVMGLFAAILIGDIGSSSYLYLHSQLYLAICVFIFFMKTRLNTKIIFYLW